MQSRPPPERLSPAALSALSRRVIAAGGLPEGAVMVHDLDFLQARLARLQGLLPSALHAVAVKANPVVALLEGLVAAGAGLETASTGELAVAAAAGCPPERVVFDSPAKTPRDLRAAIDAGLRLNADNLEEVTRLAALSPSGRVGLRVNPEVGAGSIAATSVAGPRARFGVPLSAEGAITEAFRQHPFLDGLHVHTGSQGMPLDLVLEGVKRVLALRQRLEAALGRAIPTVDVGGGVPVAYTGDHPAWSVEEWADGLRSAGATAVPELITELGRWVQAPAGFALSRVEYLRSVNGRTIATLHVGADLLLRRAYVPAQWPVEVVALDEAGGLLEGELEPVDLVGPLCFAGDVIGEAVTLPRLRPGCVVALREVGAYTLSMWSRHCSRPMPGVVGVRGEEVLTLLAAESPADVAALWSRR